MTSTDHAEEYERLRAKQNTSDIYPRSFTSNLLSQHTLRAVFDHTSPIGEYELTVNYNRNPFSGETKSANPHAVESHDPGAIENAAFRVAKAPSLSMVIPSIKRQ
jgi:hypothetical protein